MTCALAYLPYFKARIARKNAEIKLLMEKWKLAREKRELWKEEHVWLFNFDDPEYQRLWEIEIGAEDLYLLSISGISSGISWSDWRFEQKQANQETDE